MVLPALRSDARNLIDRSGKSRSCKTCRMSSPTAPVAPTTATLGTTSKLLSSQYRAEMTTFLLLNVKETLGKRKRGSGRFAQKGAGGIVRLEGRDGHEMPDSCRGRSRRSEIFMAEADSYWMQRALELAERGRGHVEPNPLVGAVLVRDGRLVGEGWHQRFGEAHAEVNALAASGEAARGATLYVTLEPCCHFGKTPPCTDAILRSGIIRVVAAMSDPFPQVAGQGTAMLRQAGVAVEVGLCEAEARRLNAPYLTLLTRQRPYVHLKWAMTLDGKIATRTGDSKWISGEASRPRL